MDRSMGRLAGLALSVAVGLALLAGLIAGDGDAGDRRSGSAFAFGAPATTVHRAGVALSVIGEFERGNRHYRAGRFEQAVEAYRAALEDGEDNPVLRYNLGTALLRLGHYDEAEEHLRGALTVVEPETREWVHYNLGQRYLEDARGQEDPQAASTLYDAAVEAYRQALRLRPEDEDAKWNYELAVRERDEQASQGGGGEEGDEGEQGDQSEQQQDEQDGGEGGGGQSQGSPSQAPEGGADPQQAPMTQEQAERILSAMEQDERELFRDKLRKGREEAPTARDW